MLQAIYSSKLFLASKRQSAIRDKIEAASNTELVQQLIRDLDDEYQTLDNVAPELLDNNKKDVSDKSSDNDVDIDIDVDNQSSDKGSSSPSIGQPIDFNDSESSSDESIELNDDTADDEPSEAIEQSTRVDVLSIDVVKGTLNHHDNTAGVSRIEKKDNEIWIYYNDDVNLNNVMTDVIELLNNAGYTYLSFNRLARSHNAMVFELTDNTCKVGDVIE